MWGKRNEIVEELEELREKILNYAKETNQEVWFYPEYKGVKGFLGTQDIILLGLNPSSGIFPSKKDELLYRLLKERGLEYIHITDLIKVRAKNKHVTDLLANSLLMKKQTEFFSDELNIIKPKIIITMGSQCDSLLKQFFRDIDKSYKVIQIIHYGYNWFHDSSKYKSTKDVFDKISKQLDKIKEEYKSLSKRKDGG